MAEDTKSVKKFDLQLLIDSFTKCAENVKTLQMDHYLHGFKELYRFFCLLGSVFSFVASDIISKVEILENYRQSEKKDNYETIQSMVEYEISNNTTINNNHPSGCRTLLRLHRALEFVMFFMRDLSTADRSAATSVIARKCYQETLARYHSFIIRWTASAAMTSLPDKKQFIKTVFGYYDAEIANECGALMSNIVHVSKIIYDETQKLYESSNLLDLP